MPSSHNNMPVSEEEIDVEPTSHQQGQSSSNDNQELRVQWNLLLLLLILLLLLFIIIIIILQYLIDISRYSPAVIDQKYSELFTFMIKAWNFARLQPTLRLTFLDMEPSQIQHWTRVLRRP